MHRCPAWEVNRASVFSYMYDKIGSYNVVWFQAMQNMYEYIDLHVRIVQKIISINKMLLESHQQNHQ